MKKVFVFIDEFGNAHLDLTKKGTFSHFVYTSVVIKETDIEQAKRIREIVSKKYFQNQPLKSKNINNDERGIRKRLDIVNEFKKLNFLIYSLVIDKKAIYGKGLGFKNVFYKYFQRIFIENLSAHFDSFQITVDKLGHDEFQKSLQEYIQKSFQTNLFTPQHKFYRLADDRVEEPLIQIADFFSGTVGKIYCNSHLHPKADLLLESIKDRLYIDFFPLDKKAFYGYSDIENQEIDSEIREIALKSVIDRIEFEGFSQTDELEILKHLLLIFKIKPDRIVTTKEIISVVKRLNPSFKQATLRQSIQNLRDQGVIIASPQGKYGYKIPEGMDDMIGFYNRYLNSITPMLKRIKKSNEKIKIGTLGKVDILSNAQNFEALQGMIDLLEATKHKQ